MCRIPDKSTTLRVQVKGPRKPTVAPPSAAPRFPSITSIKGLAADSRIDLEIAKIIIEKYKLDIG